MMRTMMFSVNDVLVLKDGDLCRDIYSVYAVLLNTEVCDDILELNSLMHNNQSHVTVPVIMVDLMIAEGCMEHFTKVVN